MPRWEIENAWVHDPMPGSDRDYAKSYELSDGTRQIQATVEFAAPSSIAGSKLADRLMKEHLEDEEPPRRVLVDPEGNVSIDRVG